MPRERVIILGTNAFWYAHKCSNPVPCGGQENEDTLKCMFKSPPSPLDVDPNVYCDIHYEPAVYIPSEEDTYGALFNFQGCKAPNECGCANSKRLGEIMIKPIDAPLKIYGQNAWLDVTWEFTGIQDCALRRQVFIVDIHE